MPQTDHIYILYYLRHMQILKLISLVQREVCGTFSQSVEVVELHVGRHGHVLPGDGRLIHFLCLQVG